MNTNQQTVTSTDGTPIAYTTLGAGPGVVVVGGALRTSEDYGPLATGLARKCKVHVVDRRGRGASGPQGPEYSLHKEVDDLLAVQKATAAEFAFGHSYGGLVVLETAKTHDVFRRIVTYEPGIATAPVPTDWIDPYQKRLAAGDPYGALAHFIRDSGGAPRLMTKLPLWYLRAMMRVVFRGRTWQRMAPLLPANLAEHQQFAAQYGRLPELAAVKAATLVLCGSRSGSMLGADSLEMLKKAMPKVVLRELDGLDHFGPEGKSAPIVAAQALAFLLTSE